MRWVAALGLGLVASMAGCTQRDVVATFDPAAPKLDAGEPDAVELDAGEADFCAGGGPVIEVGDGRCGGDLARRAFRFAVCTCEALVASGPVRTDAFDSREGTYQAGIGGALGVNGRLDLNAPAAVGGALIVSGPTGLNAGAGGELDVAQGLDCAGPVVSETRIDVQGDLRAGGRVVARDLRVGGALVLPEGAPLEVSGALDAPSPIRASTVVPPPCDCAPERLLDITSVVAARATDHDDARAGLDPSALGDARGLVRLPCGRYYFDRIGAQGDLTIRASGRVAIFVAADVSVSGALRLELDPGAELDLLIAGQLVTNSPPVIGSEARPAAARLYVGGTGTVQLGGGGRFFGNLYAPLAEVVTSGPLEVFGALFARRIAASGALTAHFDRAIEAAAEDCPPPPDLGCTSCLDCRAGGCVGGQCGPCRGDADCCAPQRCVQGACVSDWEP